MLRSPLGNITSGMIIVPKKNHSPSELFALEPPMLANRFRDLWPSTEPAAYSPAICGPMPSAFVVCPFVSSMTPMQFAQMEYLYRVAFEHAQAQFATTSAPRIPVFSLN